LIGEPRPEERAKQPASAFVSCEHPPRPVPPVRCRGEAHQQQTGTGIAKTRQRLAPVRLLRKPPDPHPRDFLAPADQAGTEATDNDPALKRSNG
jgi:hypothetical protein